MNKSFAIQDQPIRYGILQIPAFKLQIFSLWVFWIIAFGYIFQGFTQYSEVGGSTYNYTIIIILENHQTVEKTIEWSFLSLYFLSFLLNKIPSVFGPQWLEIVHPALVGIISSKFA